jgi:hypothetical protein
MDEGMVKMTHPDVAGEVAGPVTRQAFDEIWAEKGWVLAPDEESAVQPARRSRPTKEQ